MAPASSHRSDHPLASGRVRELCSGVDALYLSGRCVLPSGLVELLEASRAEAVEADEAVPFPLLGDAWELEPRSFGKYRFRLRHEFGLVGVTLSEHLPTLRVQVRAELLHGVGPTDALAYFTTLGEYVASGPVDWSLSRLDLFCDVQGWTLTGDDRDRFVCRAGRRDLHEESMAMTGLEFGQRSTKTVCARIYDKTLQVQRKGLDWWPRKWGDRFDPDRQVLRVEFEFGRQGLVEYGVRTPADGLSRAPDLWAAVSSDWLTYRTPTGDGTRARWPIADEWASVQRATLRGDAIGLGRIRADRARGQLRLIVPSLVGYTARAAALTGAYDIPTALGSLRGIIEHDEQRRGVLFEQRIRIKDTEERRR